MKDSNARKHLVFGIVLFGIATVSHSANINVTNGATDNVINGNCSVIEAIRSANDDSAIDACSSGNGDDQITLSSGVYSLTSIVDGRYGSNGTPCITSKIAIVGNGSTIRRNSATDFRIFCVGANGGLLLNDLTVSNGAASGPSITFRRGGGVMSMGALEVKNVTFRDNSAVAQGGGMLINGGTGEIRNSNFVNNTADDKGAAIRTDGNANVEISDSSFSENTAAFGGALFINNSTATITNSIFDNNQTSQMGGGVYFSGSQVNLLDSRITNNRTFGKGGGVRIDNGSDVSITRTIIDRNDSPDIGGGGIYVILSKLAIAESTISNNTAGRGAGLYVDVSATTLENTTLSGNSASVYGGAIYIDADENLAPYNASIIATNTSLINNQAGTGAGGLWMNPISKATLRNTVIALNTNRNCAGPGLIVVEEGNWFEDQYCSASAQGDPIVGPLSLNGGKTATHPLLENSPLIDAGFLAKCSSIDQTGKARPVGISCDIGAFEFSKVGKVTLAPIYDLLMDQDQPLN